MLIQQRDVAAETERREMRPANSLYGRNEGEAEGTQGTHPLKPRNRNKPPKAPIGTVQSIPISLIVRLCR
jgi:hypothetical protein